MNHISHFFFSVILMAVLGFNPQAVMAAETPADFTGKKTAWHGFDRYDFVMDDQTLAVTPFKSVVDEGDGVEDPPKGSHRCILVIPR